MKTDNGPSYGTYPGGVYRAVIQLETSSVEPALGMSQAWDVVRSKARVYGFTREHMRTAQVLRRRRG